HGQDPGRAVRRRGAAHHGRDARASRRRAQDGECRPGLGLRYRVGRGGGHARGAGRRPPRPDPREGSEEDRARSHGDPPGGAVGAIRPSAHLARPARMRGPQAAVRALPPPLPVAPAAVPTMNEIHTHWFDPVTLYRDGYPDEITSALRVSPLLRDVVREETAAAAPEPR